MPDSKSNLPALAAPAAPANTQPAEPAPVVFATAEKVVPWFDAACRLRIVSCPACSVLFALPAELHLRSLDAGKPIYCPAGHPVDLKAVQDASQSDEGSALLLYALDEVRQASAEVDRLKGLIARMPHVPVLPITEPEMSRRIRFITNRCKKDNSDYGRCISRFCEMTQKRAAGLHEHLRRSHLKEIAELPPLYFEE